MHFQSAESSYLSTSRLYKRMRELEAYDNGGGGGVTSSYLLICNPTPGACYLMHCL